MADRGAVSDCEKCIVSEHIVDFMLSPSDHTFIAPCFGGPHDGKLARASIVLQVVIIGGAFYALKVAGDGSRYWEFNAKLSSQ